MWMSVIDFAVDDIVPLVPITSFTRQSISGVNVCVNVVEKDKTCAAIDNALFKDIVDFSQTHI